jgi:hypothetical protein
MGRFFWQGLCVMHDPRDGIQREERLVQHTNPQAANPRHASLLKTAQKCTRTKCKYDSQQIQATVPVEINQNAQTEITFGKGLHETLL